MGFRIGRGLLDPRQFRHMTPSFEGDYVALVEFFVALREGDAPVWNEVTEVWEEGPSTPLWRGMARIVPNKDWRARTRNFAGEQNAEHAVRLQLNIKKNFLIPREEWQNADPADITAGSLLRVISNPNDPLLEEYRFTVRNAIGATDNWHRTVLCDVNLGGRYG